MKTLEDAIEMRRRIFTAFEAAEKETDPQKRRALLTFVIVGGGGDQFKVNFLTDEY